jgi:tetratricopeptide (TPR) repeat protein
MEQDAIAPGSGAAGALFLGEPRTLDPRVAAYIDKQGRLAELQSANLVEQNAFELSHLRWRQFNDRLRGVWQILLAFSSVVVFLGICAWVWSAHQATGLVVQSLHVPPDLAAKGLDGTVLAQRFIDKLTSLEKQSDAYSTIVATQVSGSWGSETKIDIPQTGVSVDAVSQVLRDWLGSQSHISGDVWREGDDLVLGVRSSSGAMAQVKGPERDLERLISEAADRIFADAQPARYMAVVIARGDFAGGFRMAQRLAEEGTPAERFMAYEGLAAGANGDGNFVDGIRLAREAQKLEPNGVFAVFNEAMAEGGLGHWQRSLAVYLKARNTSGRTSTGVTSPEVLREIRISTEVGIAATLGAYADAEIYEGKLGSAFFGRSYRYVPLVMAALEAGDHDIAAARALQAANPQLDDALSIECYQCAGASMPSAQTAIALGDWRAAAASLEATDRKALASPTSHELRHRLVWPWLAIAYAHLGQYKMAQGLIALTPVDCDWCLIGRGEVASLAGDTPRSDFWFARAVAHAPSVPRAYSAWGEAKMRRGDFDGAISEFSRALALGPHYADASELWGEALLAETRADLALDKFREADLRAPEWGRLHLKWGEALFWLGRKDEARAQFARAARLPLNDHDKAELAQFS